MKFSGVCYLTKDNNIEEFSSHTIIFEYAHMTNIDDDTEFENQVVNMIKKHKIYRRLKGKAYYIYYEALYSYDFSNYKRNFDMRFINFERLE